VRTARSSPVPNAGCNQRKRLCYGRGGLKSINLKDKCIGSEPKTGFRVSQTSREGLQSKADRELCYGPISGWFEN